MIAYMIRSLDNEDRYYDKVSGRWVEQEKASVWSEKWAALSNKLKVQEPSEIVSFTLEEIK